MKHSRLLSISILVIVILMLGVFINFQNSKLKGRVVKATTGEPIAKAIVVVEYRMFVGPGGSEAIYVQTNEDGTFEANLYSTEYSARVWKEGYAENGCHQNNCNQQNGKVIIKLREIITSNFVEKKEAFFDFGLKKGFSFVKGQAVDAETKDADIFFVSDLNNTIFIGVPEQSGICFKPMSEDDNFYTPVAPEDGCYQKKLILDGLGVYFVKTKGGANYAKFRIFYDVTTDYNNEERISLKESRVIWAYQPDGTRNLEIAPPTETPYPFSNFYKLSPEK